MKKLCLSITAAAVAFAFCAAPASALPAFKKEWETHYNVKEPSTDAEKSLAAAVAEAKCNSCHMGRSKKDRNAYGMELSKYLKKDDFKKDRLEAEPDKAKAEILEAFKKAEKADAGGGKTFGDKIKAGELPAPAE